MGKHSAPKGRHARQATPEAAPTRGRHARESVSLRERWSRTSSAKKLGAAALAAGLLFTQNGAFSNSDETLAAHKGKDKVSRAAEISPRNAPKGLGNLALRAFGKSKAEATPTPTPAQDSESQPPQIDDTMEYSGRTFDPYTVELIERVKEDMEEEGVPFTYITQGSFTSDNPTSGDTHAGGGAVDYSINAYGGPESEGAYDALRIFRENGFAAWIRKAGEAGPYAHLHAIAIGDEAADPSAKEQVESYLNGGDGLVNEGPDRYLESVGRPLPTWAEAVAEELQ